MNVAHPSNTKVAIAIPIYKDMPSEDDLMSLDRCFQVLGHYPIVAIKPIGLALNAYPYPFAGVEDFAPHYFDNIKGYNQLMLSAQFYARFLSYSYMLLYQTDAFVFDDQLAYWCSLNYDYIGAPWLYRGYADKTQYIREFLRGWAHRRFNKMDNESGIPTELQFHNVVGNGGFSLRKVDAFHRVCLAHLSKINEYNRREEKQFNEDAFFSIEVNRKKTLLKTPNYKKALHFSIESYPELAFKLITGKVPFGCHAWNKNRDFWRDIFAEKGYTI